MALVGPAAPASPAEQAQRHAEVSPLRNQAFLRHDPVRGRLQRLDLRRGFRPHATRTARTVKRKQRQQRQEPDQASGLKRHHAGESTYFFAVQCPTDTSGPRTAWNILRARQVIAAAATKGRENGYLRLLLVISACLQRDPMRPRRGACAPVDAGHSEHRERRKQILCLGKNKHFE
eukprot:COSAG04_NODE_7756_length_1072_cov_1.646454_2_plen_176_part_00